MTSPSMFTHTAEDLIATAKEVAESGRIRTPSGTEGLPHAACLLYSELAKSLESERNNRATQFSALRAQNIATGEAQAALTKALRFNRILMTIAVLLLIANALLVAYR